MKIQQGKELDPIEFLHLEQLWQAGLVGWPAEASYAYSIMATGMNAPVDSSGKKLIPFDKVFPNAADLMSDAKADARVRSRVVEERWARYADLRKEREGD